MKKWVIEEKEINKIDYGTEKDLVNQIIEDRKPLGRFFFFDTDRYIAIDNTTGEALMEEFRILEECISWLLEY